MEQRSSIDTARKLRREVKSIKGIHGVNSRDLSSIIIDLFDTSGPTLLENLDQVDDLFGHSYEEGLIAVGLLAATLPDAPELCFELALSWLERVDEHQTADSIGWLLIGPGMLATRTPCSEVIQIVEQNDHPLAMRSAVISGLAALPEVVSLTAAAGLRARLGTPEIRFVDEAASTIVSELLTTYFKRAEPVVRKGVRRLLGAWTRCDQEAVIEWQQRAQQMGGLHKMLSTEIARQTKKRHAKQ